MNYMLTLTTIAIFSNANKCSECVENLEDSEWDIKYCFVSDDPKQCLADISDTLNFDKLKVIQMFDSNYDSHEICQLFYQCKVNYTFYDIRRILNKKKNLIKKINLDYNQLISNRKSDKEFYNFEAILDKTEMYFN